MNIKFDFIWHIATALPQIKIQFVMVDDKKMTIDWYENYEKYPDDVETQWQHLQKKYFQIYNYVFQESCPHKWETK